MLTPMVCLHLMSRGSFIFLIWLIVVFFLHLKCIVCLMFLHSLPWQGVDKPGEWRRDEGSRCCTSARQTQEGNEGNEDRSHQGSHFVFSQYESWSKPKHRGPPPLPCDVIYQHSTRGKRVINVVGCDLTPVPSCWVFSLTWGEPFYYFSVFIPPPLVISLSICNGRIQFDVVCGQLHVIALEILLEWSS